MGAHKDRLIQAAELLDMSPDDLLTLLDSGGEPRGISFSREQVEAWAGYPMTDEQVSDLEDVLPNSTFPETVGLVAEAWRPEDDEPDREPTPAQEEAWDAREDEARGHVLG